MGFILDQLDFIINNSSSSVFSDVKVEINLPTKAPLKSTATIVDCEIKFKQEFKDSYKNLSSPEAKEIGTKVRKRHETSFAIFKCRILLKKHSSYSRQQNR